MISYILQDWSANSGSPKGRFVLAFFRACQWVRRLPSGMWILGSPILAAYVLLVHWIFGIELDYKTVVGRGLSLRHGVGLVVHQNAVIGANCTLRQGVTIGERRGDGKCPVIGDRVEFGANAIVIGPLCIGESSVVGAGAVVLHDVEAFTVVAGNPAVVVKRLRNP
jgi:putative colanic acid biosynthesis acetyltransferase WcaB